MERPVVVLTVVAESRLARDLVAGGVFVHGCELAVNERCDLAVRTGGNELRIEARVVYIDGRGGASLQLVGVDPSMKAQLEALTRSAAGTAPRAPIGVAAPRELDEDDKLDGFDAPDASGDAHDEDAADTIDMDPLTIRRPRSPDANVARKAAPLAPAFKQSVVNPDGSIKSTAGNVRSGGEGIRTADGSIRISDGARTNAKPAVPDGLPVSSRALADRHWAPEVSVPDFGDDLDERALAADSDDVPTAQAGALSAADSDDDDPADTADTGDGEPGGNRADDTEADQPATEEQRKLALNMHERLRGLTLAQQVRKAASNDPNERITLERIYGKNVWEALLRNPRLTAPEVARIARMGTLPRIMVELIVGNGAWLQIPEVRRALLANPKLGTDQILRVLRLMPKHELKLATMQTAYPMAVRDAAKRLVRET